MDGNNAINFNQLNKICLIKENFNKEVKEQYIFLFFFIFFIFLYFFCFYFY